ncbi:MAG: lytic transglycosylase domain-containing protein [Paucibacter sp.]|nr:lytic transglycosylase domain-containing protein [Roseateles sp.]
MPEFSPRLSLAKPWRPALMLSALLALGGLNAGCQAQAIANPPPNPELVAEAKEALRLKDRARLAAANAMAQAQQHPLASWIDYWDLGLRLTELSQADLEAFYARWRGSYVEDRMRNDWLLELGRRRDWADFALDYPRFKMNDDREVSCYALLTEYQQGRDVLDRARSTWLAQRDGDDGCQLLASTLYDAKKFTDADIWLKLRYAFENNKPRAIKQAASLLGKPTQMAIADIQDNAVRYLSRKASASNRLNAELSTVALIRVAANDSEQAADLLERVWTHKLPDDLAAWAWAQVARNATFNLLPEAADHYLRALKLAGISVGTNIGTNIGTPADKAPAWSIDTLGGAVRAGLRADAGKGRPALVLQAIQLMPPAEQARDAWQYWRARAQLDLAPAGKASDAQRTQAQQALQALASPLHYYGQLAAEDLGLRLPLPATPRPPSDEEKGLAFVNPGLNRGLALLAYGLRSEGVREWNFTLIGMNDRDLLAAAALACEREVWDRCISASERTRTEVSIAQRFPLPFRKEVLAKAGDIGLDPAYVYGLIRQESRFVMDARSSVGASGLMQIMPNTARWTAKKAGIEFRPEWLSDRDFNLRIGTQYLKLVLDDLDGSTALAAAAYNAGPNRPRRWRDGPVLDAAVWTENIPFNETRDYVKKVLSNSAIYAQLLGEGKTSLRERLGQPIGPKSADAPPSNTELP